MLSRTFRKQCDRSKTGIRLISTLVDTFIVGGDAPGLATAAALSKSDFFTPNKNGEKRIVILDNKQIPELKYYKYATNTKTPDQNTVTISFTTLQLLKSLGALDKMNHLLITPYRKLFVNEQFGKSYVNFDDEIIDRCLMAQAQQGFYDYYISKHSYNFQGKSSLGASAENNHIKSALYDVINDYDKWEVIKNDKISFIRPTHSLDGLSVIELESGRRFKARLIIGNDGRKSYVRNAHDIECSKHSYNQKCIVKALIHTHPLQGAFQRFLPSGTIAILPMWKNYSFLTWTCSNLMADELLELSHKEFIDEVNRQFYLESKYKFGAFLDRYLPSMIKDINFELPPKAVYDKESQKLKEFSYELESYNASVHAKDRVALIGNSATALHPITGHGYNLGMTASAHLSNAIINQMKSGGDIGSYEHWLKDFANQTKKNETQTQAIQEIYKKGYVDTLFGSETWGKAISIVRNMAVDVIESVPIVKYNFAFYAAGLTTHPNQYEWEVTN